MHDFAISVNNLKKVYPIYNSPRERYMDFFLPGNYGKRFYALQDVTFNLEKGRCLGLLGMNGSGKSTLANIVAGATSPTSGSIETQGHVSMSSISGGINIHLTGMENIIQKCLFLGLTHKEIKELTDEIIDFSELGTFINQPTKTYSSGMRSKLAFAISANVDPDILVIDEALSVGDPTFTEKCLKKMRSFQERGKTILFVSHAVSQIRDFCDTALWLEGGKVREFGDVKGVVRKYADFIREFNELPSAEQRAYKNNIWKNQFETKKERT